MATATLTSDSRAPRAHAIDDARHPVARRIADVLRSRAARPTVFVIDDLENVEQAVASGIALESLFVSESASAALADLPRLAPDAPVHVLDEAVAATLFGGQRRARVFALAHAPRPPRLHDIVGRRGDVVVLDGVRLVGNIGAITRTASALGAAGVIAVDSGLRTTLDRRLIRASRGLVLSTPVVLADREACAAFLERERLATAVLEAGATLPLRAIRTVRARLALVLGAERHGVSRALGDGAAHRYAVPMAAGVESLNVSVAAGLALYERREA